MVSPEFLAAFAFEFRVSCIPIGKRTHLTDVFSLTPVALLGRKLNVRLSTVDAGKTTVCAADVSSSNFVHYSRNLPQETN